MSDVYSSSQLVSAGINYGRLTYKQINEVFEYTVKKKTFVCDKNGVVKICESLIFFVKNCNIARSVFGDRSDIEYV